MLCRRAYRFKLEPNTEQTQKLYQLAGARRFICNWALARRNEFYKASGKTLPASQLSRELTQLKQQEDRLWFQEADSQLLQQALKDVDTAFQNFFAKRGRFPKFKSRNRGHFAFRIPQRVKVENGRRGAPGRVYCPKIGWIGIRQSQEVEGITKSATFKRDACGDWFVTLTTEFEMPDTALAPPENPVGVDLGLKEFVTLSDGTAIGAPQFFRKSAGTLKKAQRVLSRRKLGSKRRGKAKQKAAQVHRKAANQRGDFVHKVTTRLVQEYDAICIEDLNVRGMAKNHSLALSIHDVAFGEFRRQLAYKCQWQRKHLSVVSRWFPSSKMCGVCGVLNDTLTLADREWTCCCGVTHQRDANAAGNILKEGVRLLEGLRILAVGQTDKQNARGQNVRLATASCSG